MLVERYIWRELRLVVGRVEAHLQLGPAPLVHLDVVHGLERFLCVFESVRLINTGQSVSYFLFIVEILVVLLHVVAVPVGNRDVVREFG